MAKRKIKRGQDVSAADVSSNVEEKNRYVIEYGLEMSTQRYIGDLCSHLQPFVRTILAGSTPSLGDVEAVMTRIKYGDKTLLEVLSDVVEARKNKPARGGTSTSSGS